MPTLAEFSSAAVRSLAGLKMFNQAGCSLALDAFLAPHEKEGQTVKKENKKSKKITKTTLLRQESLILL